MMHTGGIVHLIAIWFAVSYCAQIDNSVPAPTDKDDTFICLSTKTGKAPQPTSYTNDTGGCKPDCRRANGVLNYNGWYIQSVLTTLTIETVVTVINRKNNATKTKTITNTDLGDFPVPTNTNSEGYQTAAKTITDTLAKTTRTVVVTFPSMLLDYPSEYVLSGQISTTVNGKPSCTSISQSSDAHFTYPAHPLVPQRLDPGVDKERLKLDPKGWTFTPYAMDYLAESLDDLVKPLFPHLPMWQCKPDCGSAKAAPNLKKAALFLTDHSTSFEGDDGSATAQVQDGVQAAPARATQPPEVLQGVNNKEGPKPAQPNATPAASDGSMPQVVPAVTPTTSLEESTTKQDQGIPSEDKQAPQKVASDQSKAGADSPAKPPPTASAANAPTVGQLPAPANGNPPQSPPSSGTGTTAGTSGSDETRVGSDRPADQPPTAGSPVIPATMNQPQNPANGNTQGSTQAGSNAVAADLNGNQASILSSNIPVPAAADSKASPGNNNVPSAAGPIPSIRLGAASNININIPEPTTPPRLTLDQDIYTANPAGAFIIKSQTLAPAGNGITLSGAKISIQIDGAIIKVASSSTQTILPASATPPKTFALGQGQVASPNAKGEYVIASQTLAPGGKISVSGTPIALDAEGGRVTVGTAIQTLGRVGASASQDSARPLTVGGSVITPNAQGQYVIASQTLTRGGRVTVLGTPVALDGSGERVTVGTAVQSLGRSSSTPTGFGRAVGTGSGTGLGVAGQQRNGTQTPVSYVSGAKGRPWVGGLEGLGCWLATLSSVVMAVG